jgi:hypothetical protein
VRVVESAQPRRPVKLTGAHRILVGVAVVGAVVIAGIGFVGSYATVRDLALREGFGSFATVFPIGVDAGIVVLLALDLLLTWLRIPFPLLGQTAWLLTAATIAFNAAAAWPDPLGVGMHSVIPVLFVVSAEAARHAVGRVADLTAGRHMEGVRLARWLLAPWPTFRLWRRMKLGELRSYDQVIRLEQERLVYQARLRSRYGRGWRRTAPVEALMPLRLAHYGVPLTDTVPAGPAAAGTGPAPQTPAPDAETAVAGAAPTPVSVPEPACSPQRADGGCAGPDQASGRREARRRRLGGPPGGLRPARRRAAPAPDGQRPGGRAAGPVGHRRGPGHRPPGPAHGRAAARRPATRGGAADHGGPVLPGLGAARRGPRNAAERRPPVRDPHRPRPDRPRQRGRRPSTLRRYLPDFRAYTAWRQYLDDQGTQPTADQLADLLARRGFTADAYIPAKLKRLLDDFPRRRAALTAGRVRSQSGEAGVWRAVSRVKPPWRS